MAMHKKYYKGEGGGFPQVQAVVSLMSSCLLVALLCIKSAQTNLFGLCKSMWIIDSFVTYPSPHPGGLTRPCTLEMLRAREHTPTPYPSIVFTFRLAVESIKELGGALKYTCSPDHFHSTWINCLIFLVMHVGLILNSCSWVHPSLSPEL
jgi:hypothetical protein